ncbi:MAG: hypothetical protein Q8O56_07275 [Solirubrobacteraceae bacterium]|nr:hypothetical protein [Solirubrobacteraceae bacterium]
MEEVVGLEGRMYVRSGAAMVRIDAEGIHASPVREIPGVVVALSLPLYPG